MRRVSGQIPPGLRTGLQRSLPSWKLGLMWTLRLSIYDSCNCEFVTIATGLGDCLRSLDPFFSDPSCPRYEKPTATVSTPHGNTFDLTVICPPLIFGPWVHPLGPSGPASLHYPNSEIVNIIRGEYRSSQLPKSFSPHWVDVRDVALAHLEAALRLDCGASNERYVTCSPDKFNCHLVGEVIREEFPEWAEEVLPPKEETPVFRNVSLDGDPATRELGVTYRSFRECIVDLVRQLREEMVLETEANKS